MQPKKRPHASAVFGSRMGVGTSSGLIGLGGAAFRLPLLIGVFGFEALPAVIVNKATSLVVVASSLPFRSRHIPFSAVFDRWDVILTLLGGSLIGVWFGAGWATVIKSSTLHKVLAVLLLAISGVLLFGHGAHFTGIPIFSGAMLVGVGVVVGFGIGVVASLMGVADGELLIPTIILSFGADVKLAGSLSLAVSFPTTIVGFTRYSRDRSFTVIRRERRFLAWMAAGSIIGTFIGGQLLGIVPDQVLLPMLAAILIILAVKVWPHWTCEIAQSGELA